MVILKLIKCLCFCVGIHHWEVFILFALLGTLPFPGLTWICKITDCARVFYSLFVNLVSHIAMSLFHEDHFLSLVCHITGESNYYADFCTWKSCQLYFLQWSQWVAYLLANCRLSCWDESVSSNGSEILREFQLSRPWFFTFLGCVNHPLYPP